jgi:hypothetical protein
LYQQVYYISPVSHSRIFFVLLLIISFGFQSSSSAAGGVEVRVVKSARIETPPGKVITIGFSVTNTTDTRQQYTPEIILPAGWRIILRPSVFDLEAHQADVSLISFSIPSEIPVGEYPVRFRVNNKAVPSQAGDAVLTVDIRPVHRIEMMIIESPRYVVGGEQIDIQFSLSNRGNASASIRLRSRSIAIDSVHFDSTLVHLRPNEVRKIEAIAYSDNSIQVKLQTFVELTALLLSDTTVSSSVSVSVQLIPVVSNVKSNRFYYPLKLKTRIAGSRFAIGPQLEISGYGPLADGGTDCLDILLKAPETISRSVLGDRDEYKVAYRSKIFDAYAGDQNYILSPLTEYGRYASGGGGRATFAGVTVGGFYNNNRYTNQKQIENAGFLSYQFSDGFSLGVNYLNKDGTDEGEIVSVRSLIRPITNTELDIEFGRGKNVLGNDDAYSAKISGRAPWYSYSGWYIHAGSGYPGYFRDMNSVAGNFSFNPWRSVRFEG